MWAKAVPEVFAHEVAVTSLLADIDPGVVPPVVAADPALGRFITVHVDGPALAAVVDEPAAWQATMSRLAELQRVAGRGTRRARDRGRGGAPLAGLADAVPRLLADDDAAPGRAAGWPVAAEAAALRDGVPSVVAACHELASSGVPDSLEHGDLSADEVIIGEMGPVFLDWSDGSITHPFLSAAAFLGHASAAPAASDGRPRGRLPRAVAGAGLGLTDATGRRGAWPRPASSSRCTWPRCTPIGSCRPRRHIRERHVVPDALRSILSR